MKNKIEDLRNHLFEALERLNDDEHMKNNKDAEIERAHAIASIGAVLVQSAKVEVDFMKQAKRLTESGFITPTEEPLKIEEPKKEKSVFERF
jgi:hypothetical protein